MSIVVASTAGAADPKASVGVIAFAKTSSGVAKPMVSASSLTQRCYTFKSLPTSETLDKIAGLYAEAFADPPWNEFKVCKNMHYFGREAETKRVCDKCATPLEPAYPKDRTVKYITGEITKPNGTLVLFEDSTATVCAAGWAFVYTLDEFKTKYSTSQMQERAVTAIKTKTQKESVFYLSEIMVDKRARNQGIATKIATFLKQKAQEGKYDMLMRTHKDSPMAKIAINLGMQRIIDVDKNKDTETEGRILCLI